MAVDSNKSVPGQEAVKCSHPRGHRPVLGRHENSRDCIGLAAGILAAKRSGNCCESFSLMNPCLLSTGKTSVWNGEEVRKCRRYNKIPLRSQVDSSCGHNGFGASEILLAWM